MLSHCVASFQTEHSLNCSDCFYPQVIWIKCQICESIRSAFIMSSAAIGIKPIKLCDGFYVTHFEFWARDIYFIMSHIIRYPSDSLHNPFWILGSIHLLYHESNHQTSQWFPFSPILCSHCYSQYNMTKVEDNRMHWYRLGKCMLNAIWYNNVWKIIPVLHQVVQQSFLQMLSKSLVSLLLIAIPFVITNVRYRHRFWCRGQSMKQFRFGYFKTYLLLKKNMWRFWSAMHD